MEYDKIIESMAKAIEARINSGNVVGLIENSKITFVLDFDGIAKAALAALQNELPVVCDILQPPFNGDIKFCLEQVRDTNKQNSKMADLYKELRTLGREKNF